MTEDDVNVFVRFAGLDATFVGFPHDVRVALASAEALRASLPDADAPDEEPWAAPAAGGAA